MVCPPIWRTFRTRCRYHESEVTAGGGRAVFLGAEAHAPGLVGAPKGAQEQAYSIIHKPYKGKTSGTVAPTMRSIL